MRLSCSVCGRPVLPSCSVCGRPVLPDRAVYGALTSEVYHESCATTTVTAPPLPCAFGPPFSPRLTEADVRRIVREELARTDLTGG